MNGVRADCAALVGLLAAAAALGLGLAVHAAEPAPAEWPALTLLGISVAPATRRDVEWTVGQSFAGTPLASHVVVIRGHAPGPTLCLTAAIHGDELNGVEIVRRVLADTRPDRLRGTLIGVPIVNLLGFNQGSRYLPDRRDLNRYFPGDPDSSSAARIAHSLFDSVIRGCDRLVDFHTASFKRDNLPQIRANLARPGVLEFARTFGATSIVHKSRELGTLRNAATAAGITAVTFELGEPGTLQLDQVAYGVAALESVLAHLGMAARPPPPAAVQAVFHRSRWMRTAHGGILVSSAELGAWVRKGDLLGSVINPSSGEQSEIRSAYDGRVLGRALNQLVLPGFAAFNIGIEGTEFKEHGRKRPAARRPRSDP